MNNLQIIGCLIGLTGAINNNSKTSNTDSIVRSALLSEDSPQMLDRIRREKFTIAPDCAHCSTPCGNTSDYDPSRFDLDSEETRLLKYQVIETTIDLASHTEPGEKLPDLIYQALAYLGYELENASYQTLLEEMNACSERSYR